MGKTSVPLPAIFLESVAALAVSLEICEYLMNTGLQKKKWWEAPESMHALCFFSVERHGTFRHSFAFAMNHLNGGMSSSYLTWGLLVNCNALNCASRFWIWMSEGILELEDSLHLIEAAFRVNDQSFPKHFCFLYSYYGCSVKDQSGNDVAETVLLIVRVKSTSYLWLNGGYNFFEARIRKMQNIAICENDSGKDLINFDVVSSSLSSTSNAAGCMQIVRKAEI